MKNILYSLIGIVFVTTISSCSDQPAETKLPDPIAVKVSKVESNLENRFISTSGQIEAENTANLSTRMMGYVNQLHVKVGDKVNKGQLLININNADLQAKKAQVDASIIQAEAGYKNAKKDYERFQKLFEQGSASQKELDDMTTRFQMAEAGLQAAKQMKNEVQAQFSYVNIEAPFSGVITNTFVESGDMANPGMPLLSLESEGKKQVATMVAEKYIDAIKVGMPVNVLVKSSGESISGEVVEASSSAKLTGGQYMIKIDLKDDNKNIFSGMYVNVQFPLEDEKNANTSTVLVPQSVLVEQGQLTGIYTVSDDNKAVLRWLRTGKKFGDKVEILSGLAPSEAYIVSAEGKLYNGALLSIN